MKRKLLIIAAIMCCAALITTGTIAYFTAQDTAQNRITSGNVAIVIHEAGDDGEPFTDVVDVVPGDNVTKVVTVENTGANPVWVRVAVEYVVNLVEGAVSEFDGEELSFDFNTTDWTYSEGYYYYNSILEPGATTTALFNTVSFNIELGNEYMNSVAVIDVNAYATQSANNGATVLEAQGWPEP